MIPLYSEAYSFSSFPFAIVITIINRIGTNSISLALLELSCVSTASDSLMAHSLILSIFKMTIVSIFLIFGLYPSKSVDKSLFKAPLGLTEFQLVCNKTEPMNLTFEEIPYNQTLIILLNSNTTLSPPNELTNIPLPSRAQLQPDTIKQSLVPFTSTVHGGRLCQEVPHAVDFAAFHMADERIAVPKHCAIEHACCVV